MSDIKIENNDHADQNDQNTPTHETTVIHNSPRPSQNNANMMMVLVMIVILLIGVAVAFALKNKSSNSEEQVKRDILKRQIMELNGGTDNMLANGASYEARITSIVDNANNLRTGYETMKAGYVTSKQKYIEQLNANKGNVQTITSLGNQITRLNLENNKLKALAGNASAYQAQVTSLNEQLRLKSQQLAELQGRPTKANLTELESALSTARMTKSDLQAELKRLKQKMMMMADAGDLDDMKNKIALLEKENGNLIRRMQALQASLDFTNLFVTKDKLPVKAQELYDRLKKLETVNTSELAAAYSKIGQELEAENLQQVKFASGSAMLNFADQNAVKNNLKTTGPKDYFLVVGYASTTGDAKNNETLSAKRATSVASMVNQLKSAGQDVKAVYLGQTKRFSKTNHLDNQLCEVWQIKQ